MTDVRSLIGTRGIWGHLATLPAGELRSFVARAGALGYGTLWVGEGSARDPFALLAAVSDASSDITLGTSIVNIFGRDAMASKMGAMTMHELTGGRFVLGLGVSHVHLVQKLRGHAYERPFTRMREYVEAYRQLPYRGPHISDEEGEPTEPPVLLAALRQRMVRLAAGATDGVLPFLVSAQRVAWMRGVLDAASGDRGRPVLATTMAAIVEPDAHKAHRAARTWLQPYCRAINYQQSLSEQGFDASDWEPPYSDRLVDTLVAWGDAATVQQRLEELEMSGADHVAIVPLNADGAAEHVPVLEALAPRP